MHLNPVKLELWHVHLKACVCVCSSSIIMLSAWKIVVHYSESLLHMYHEVVHLLSSELSVNKNVLIFVLTFQLTVSVFVTLIREPGD